MSSVDKVKKKKKKKNLESSEKVVDISQASSDDGPDPVAEGIPLSADDAKTLSVLSDERNNLNLQLGQLRDNFLNQEAALRQQLRKVDQQSQVTAETLGKKYEVDPTAMYLDAAKMTFLPIPGKKG